MEPEEVETIELAFDYRPTKSLSGKLNLFYYESENLIELDQTFTFQNIGEQKGRGAEVELQWQASEDVSVKANFSYLKSELPLINSDKERVPGLMGHVDVRYQLTENLLLSTQSYWIANRKRAANDIRPAVDNYLQTDINLIWRGNSAWTLSAGLKNAFNDKIVEPVPDSALFAIGLGFPDDYPMESRSIFVAASYTFE